MEAIEAAAARLVGWSPRDRSPARLAGQVLAVRALARSQGLWPAVAVSHALEAALARGDGALAIRGWIALMTEAVRSRAVDAEAARAYLAAGAVRHLN